MKIRLGYVGRVALILSMKKMKKVFSTEKSYFLLR
jgi:hypothetical protein